jgi:hypothetical protein
VNLIAEKRNELPVQPGWILPELSFDALRERAGTLPERRLIIAVLEDAVMCYEKYMFARAAHDRRTFDQAESWFMRRGASSDDESFSFEFICDALGLDPDGIRGQLRSWRLRRAPLASETFVSSRQRCRWRAVYREPYKERRVERSQERLVAYA